MMLASRLVTDAVSVPQVSSDLPVAPDILVCGLRHPQRQKVEAFIRQKFHHDYHAVVRHFMPTLLALECAPDQIGAALGCRKAAVEPLFLEKYLDTSVEARLGEVFGCVIPRHTIVEVGNLAADKRAGSWLLFVALCIYLRRTGSEWVVCTVTPAVANTFRRMGIPFREIAVADGNRLGAERADWGSYYAKRITLQAISVSECYASFLQNPCIAAILPTLESDLALVASSGYEACATSTA